MSEANMSSADRMYDRPYEPTLHAQALARIEEWEHDLCETGLCDATPIAQKSLARLKAVLELHPVVYVSCGCDDPTCYKQDDYYENCPACNVVSPCPTADLIISGVLGE